MSATMQTHEVTAFYDDRQEAQQAMQRVVDAGVPSSDVRLVEGNDPSADPATRTATAEGGDNRGFFEKLGDFFMPEEDRYTYAEGLNRGGYIVSARVTAEQHDQVAELLDTDTGIDLDEREQGWRDEGWTGYEAGAVAGGASGGATARTDMADDDTIDVVKEELKIGKRDVSHGRVRVRSYVVEDQVSEDVTLRQEHVEVERHAVDRPVTDADAAFQDQTIEAEETGQEAVVSKEARVVEEIDVSKHAETETEQVSDTVRHTEVEIEDDRKR